MAQSLDYYTQQAHRNIAPIYDIQEQEFGRQITGAQNDPYYTSLLQGLEATKTREFSGIESRAAQRGVAYGNIPSQAQGAYLGEKYLPAVAAVKKTQADYISNLQIKLAELKARRAEAASEYGFKLRESDIAREESAKDRAASAANARAAAKPTEWQTKMGMSEGYASDLGNLGQIMFKTGWTREQAANELYKSYAGLGYKKEDIQKEIYGTYGDNWESGFYRNNMSKKGGIYKGLNYDMVGKNASVSARYADIIRQQTKAGR
jgi:hypothetical protein